MITAQIVRYTNPETWSIADPRRLGQQEDNR